MTYKLYQMRDNVTGLFTYPILTFNNDNEAVRYFKWAIENGQVPPMSKYDLELYCVGKSNAITGCLDKLDEEKIFIARSADFKKENTND